MSARTSSNATGVGRGPGVKSADRTLELIELVAERGSVSFSEILRALGLPRSSAHGLLKTLVASRWISQDGRRSEYSLGLRAWQVGQRYTGNTELVDIAKPMMDRLAAELGETVQLAQLDGVDNVYIAISQPARSMRLVSSVGARLEAHATGIGKALLGQLSPGEAEERLRAQPLSKPTKNTINDVDLLLQVLDRDRLNGYSLDDEEYISGCRCVAVPLTRPGAGTACTALSVTMPTSRTDETWPGSIIAPLTAAAEEIRDRLGMA